MAKAAPEIKSRTICARTARPHHCRRNGIRLRRLIIKKAVGRPGDDAAGGSRSEHAAGDRSHAQDAYVALGTSNYVIGCLPGYKRAFLWFGGIHGDRTREWS